MKKIIPWLLLSLLLAYATAWGMSQRWKGVIIQRTICVGGSKIYSHSEVGEPEAYNVTDNGGEAYTVIDNGGEDYNVQ